MTFSEKPPPRPALPLTFDPEIAATRTQSAQKQSGSKKWLKVHQMELRCEVAEVL